MAHGDKYFCEFMMKEALMQQCMFKMNSTKQEHLAKLVSHYEIIFFC